jgi:hypothetical protein
MSRRAGSFAPIRALVRDLDGTRIDSKLDLALAVNAPGPDPVPTARARPLFSPYRE